MHAQSRLLSAVALAACLGPVHAEIERQHDAHVHGQGRLLVALDGAALSLELRVPGLDLVGFERPPANPEEAAAVARVEALLSDLDAWLRVDPAGQCRMVSADAHGHGFGVAEAAAADSGSAHAEHAHHGHSSAATPASSHSHEVHPDPHENHAHDDPADSHGGHADFHGRYQLACQQSVALRWLELRLGEQFPAAVEMEVTVLSEELQSQRVFQGATFRVPMKP